MPRVTSAGSDSSEGKVEGTLEAEVKGVQKKLEEELARLKAKVGLAGELQVVWDPRPSSGETRGRVEDSIIFVFDVDKEKAMRTLKHEYVEYILTKEFLTPKIFEAKAHRRADALIDIIASLI